MVRSFEGTSLQFLILVIEYVYARVAQLVEYDLAKVGVAGSSPVSRSFLFLSLVFRAFFSAKFDIIQRNVIVYCWIL